jgi:hypothetical protein
MRGLDSGTSVYTEAVIVTFPIRLLSLTWEQRNMRSLLISIHRAAQQWGRLWIRAFLVLTGVALLGRAFGNDQRGPCSGFRTTKGNACGKSAKCTPADCTTWFTTAGNTKLVKKINGRATDNWNSTTNQTPCGNAGKCSMQGTKCIQLQGSARSTNKVPNGGQCSVS